MCNTKLGFFKITKFDLFFTKTISLCIFFLGFRNKFLSFEFDLNLIWLQDVAILPFKFEFCFNLGF